MVSCQYSFHCCSWSVVMWSKIMKLVSQRFGMKVVGPLSDSSWQWHNYYMLGTTILHFHLRLTLKKVQKQEKKSVKNVGMAYQKVCKEGICRDKVKGKVNIQSSIPTSFYTTLCVEKMQGWGSVKRCRDRVMYVHLYFYLIPTLFAYFLACQPYVFVFLCTVHIHTTPEELHVNLRVYIDYQWSTPPTTFSAWTGCELVVHVNSLDIAPVFIALFPAAFWCINVWKIMHPKSWGGAWEQG